ncbi:MAG: response regulator transcription factor [Wenzhouxiangellaceae bacterium]
MNTARILLIEDHPATATTVELYLRQAGYQVTAVADGDCARLMLDKDWDLLIIDVMLPGADGRELCRQVKEMHPVPVILLTALDAESERLAGFDAGADDYVSKPFSPRELVARVKARLRPAQTRTGLTGRIRIADVVLDRAQRQLWFMRKLIHLTPNEFDLLATLMAAPGRAFTRDELVERVMGHDYTGSNKVIDTHIHRIRQQLAAVNAPADLLETVFGYGYRCNPAIQPERH